MGDLLKGCVFAIPILILWIAKEAAQALAAYLLTVILAWGLIIFAAAFGIVLLFEQSYPLGGVFLGAAVAGAWGMLR